MAQAKKCDICGALFDYDQKDNAENAVAFGHSLADGSIGYRRWFDTCPDCVNAVKETINKRKGERKDDQT